MTNDWTPTATSIWLALVGLVLFVASRALDRRAQYYRLVESQVQARTVAGVLFFVSVAMLVLSLVVYVITGAA